MDDKEKFALMLTRLTGGKMTEFAEKTGINLGTCSKIKNGKMPIGSLRAKKIASVYPQISLDWLLGRSEDSGTITPEDGVRNLEKLLAEKDSQIQILLRQVSFLQRMLEEKMQ